MGNHQNYDLQESAKVRQALLYLKQAEGGHYQTQTTSETIYWNQRSRLRSGKAYHKGPHMRRQVKRGKLNSRQIDWIYQIGYSEKNWYQYSSDDLNTIHQEYFKPLLDSVVTRRDMR